MSFLKVLILIVKYNLRMGAGGQRSSHLWKIRDRCCTDYEEPHSVSEDMASWLGRGAD